MTTRFKSGQWINKEDILKLGEVRWEKFREKYRSEHCTTDEFIHYGLHKYSYENYVVICEDGDLTWWWQHHHGDQITYETILEYIGEKEMKEFNLKTQPWWIKVENEEQSKAVQKWLFEQGITWCSGDDTTRNTAFQYLTNFNSDGVEPDGFMWTTLPTEYVHTPDKEIKLSFSLKVDKVEFPSVKSEKEIHLEKLKEQIEVLSKQASVLEKAIKGEMQ